MSNLKELLYKRRCKFYEGASLQKHCEDFLHMIEDGALVHDFGDTIIVLEQYGLPENYRGWLLFDKFTRNTAKSIEKVTKEFKSKALYASTHDERIVKMLSKFGFKEYERDQYDFYLVYKPENHHGL